MTPTRLRDMIVLLPGITGSVLSMGGKDLWAISGQAACRALGSLGRSLENLKMKGQDPGGVVATKLIPDAHLVPGLVKIDGYTAMADMIRRNFQTVETPIDGTGPANFVEFPYDWRLDNRVNAKALASVVEHRLDRWQKYSQNPEARVIFVAHSMGGLVARYYLEVLDGWANCRALITFGTPFRGSLNALNYLCNGYKKAFVDLTEAMRTFPAIYQLLPIYPTVKVGQKYVRVAESEALPGMDMDLARDALNFHREIEQRVTENQRSARYLSDGYALMPMVGVRQPTLQSGTLVDGRMLVSADLPSDLPAPLSEGDGTVPRLSAIPTEMKGGIGASFVAERHGSLQCNPHVLGDVRGRLEQLQVAGLEKIRGALASQTESTRASLSLEIDDLYVLGERALIRVRSTDGDDGANGVVADVTSLSDSKSVASALAPQKLADAWQFDMSRLPAGLYRIKVRSVKAGAEDPLPIQDLFEIAG